MNREVKQSVVVKNTLYEVMNSCFPVQDRGAATCILALLAFNEIGIDQGISTLKLLNNNQIYTRIFAEEDYFRSSKMDHFIELSGNDDWTKLVDFTGEIEDQFDELFIPITSFSLVSELVHFINYRPLARIIQRALLKGKKVTMIEETANPYSTFIREANWDKGTNVLKQELFTQLKKLQGYGVTLIHSEQVKSHFKTEETRRKNLLTEEDVLKARRNQQKVIYITNGTLITPLAMDTAREIGIHITIM